MYYVGYLKQITSSNGSSSIEVMEGIVELLPNGIGIAESIDEDGMIFERVVL